MAEVQGGPEATLPPGRPGDDSDAPEPEAAVRRLVTEDWAATILGLALLLLALAGVIGKGMIP